MAHILAIGVLGFCYGAHTLCVQASALLYGSAQHQSLAQEARTDTKQHLPSPHGRSGGLGRLGDTALHVDVVLHVDVALQVGECRAAKHLCKRTL
jgi:predicted dienelactone hydrolase